MRVTRQGWAAVLAVVGIGACEGRQATDGQVTTVDSAGIRITAFDPSGVIVPEAAFVQSKGPLAAGLDSLLVDRLAGVAAQTDSAGNPIVAVGDNGRMTISVFDGQGAIIGQFGRRGQGPGEYTDLEVVGLLDARQVVVHDPLRQRFVWADFAGNELAILPIRGSGWGAVIPLVAARDGALLVATHTRLPDPVAKGTVRPRVHLRRATALGAGEALDFGVIQGDAIIWKSGGPEGLTMGEAPFGTRLLATTHGGMTTVAGADDNALRVYDSVGVIRGFVRLKGEAIPVTDQAVAAYRSSVASRSKGYEAEWAMLTSDDVFPKFMPRVTRLLSDPTGQRWVFLQHDIAQRQASAIVLDTMGLPVLRATLPSYVRPLAMLDHQLIGLSIADDGAEHLVVFDLRRR